MARRRRQKPKIVTIIEACFAGCAGLVVLTILAVGPRRLPELLGLLVSLVVSLFVLGALVVVGWVVWKIGRPWLQTKSDPGFRVLHYPQECRVPPPTPSTTYAPPAPQPRSEPKRPESPPPQNTQPTATGTQSAPQVPVGDLAAQFRALDWFQFEKIVALIYRKLGNEVERRGGANPDGGIDLLLRRDGATLGVQCKHWKTWKVGVKAVREFLGALTAAGLQEGIFVSLGEFSPDAATLACRHGIRLVDARDLAELVDRAGVRSDPEFCDALTDPRKYCPKCERELVLRTAKKGDNAGQQFWGCSTYPRCSYILRT